MWVVFNSNGKNGLKTASCTLQRAEQAHVVNVSIRLMHELDLGKH